MDLQELPSGQRPQRFPFEKELVAPAAGDPGALPARVVSSVKSIGLAGGPGGLSCWWGGLAKAVGMKPQFFIVFSHTLSRICCSLLL